MNDTGSAVGGASELAAVDPLLNQHSRALGEGITHGRCHIGGIFDHGHAEAGPANGRLHENGELQRGGNLGGESLQVGTLMHERIRRALDNAEVPDIALAGVFVECDGTYGGRAGAEGDAQHLQIALELAALAGSTVLHDIDVVEMHLLAQHGDAEIGLVHLRARALGESHAHGVLLLACHQLPLAEAGEKLVNIILVAVDARSGEFPAAARHLPFGGIAAVDNGYGLVLCHITRNNTLLLIELPPAPRRWSRYRRRCSSG